MTLHIEKIDPNKKMLENSPNYERPKALSKSKWTVGILKMVKTLLVSFANLVNIS